MHMVTITLIFLGSLIAFTSATPSARSGMFVRSSKSDVPLGFAHQGAAPPDKSIPLRVALVQNNIGGLEKALDDVSNPSSSNYGKHLSKEKVEEFVKPAQASVDAVNAFLESNGIKATTLSPAGDWLGFSVPVNKANEMFDANFAVYKHIASGQELVRTLSYSIPSSLQDHLDFVHPTISFAVSNGSFPLKIVPLKHNGTATQSGPQPAAVPPSCNSIITPACLQALYGIPTALATQPSNKMAVTGYTNSWAQQADLYSFLATLRPDMNPRTTASLQTIDGGSNPQGPQYAGLEANLDIQYTVGVAQGVPITFISVGPNNRDGFEGHLDLALYLLSLSPPPQVVTTSYGFDENNIDPNAANNLCNAYMQLGARGVSMIFASGDGGVGGGQPKSCGAFIATFPSTCPYATSVGGTQGVPETAAGLSSGGFSAIFSRPSYQASAVGNYLNRIAPLYAGKFNPNGRAFPDVAAQAENVEIVNGGIYTTAYGTSAASPMFASIIALLNDRRIATGNNPLGFLNPLLYTYPGVLNDIASGSNPGCGTNGFPSLSGWDPVTGLGTPNYGALARLVGV